MAYKQQPGTRVGTKYNFSTVKNAGLVGPPGGIGKEIRQTKREVESRTKRGDISQDYQDAANKLQALKTKKRGR